MNFFKIFSKFVARFIILFSVVFGWNGIKAEDTAAVNPALAPTCYSCEGASCFSVSKLNATTQCTDSLDYCVTVFKGFTVAARGCYAELPPSLREKCDLDSHPECAKCVGNRCNDKGREDLKCIECKSTQNINCATAAASLRATQCPIPTAANSYCYVRQNNDGTTHRGCLVHQREQRQCLNDVQCSMCVSDFSEACNTYKMTTRTTSGGVGSLVGYAKVNSLIIIAFMLAMLFAIRSISI